CGVRCHLWLVSAQVDGASLPRALLPEDESCEPGSPGAKIECTRHSAPWGGVLDPRPIDQEAHQGSGGLFGERYCDVEEVCCMDGDRGFCVGAYGDSTVLFRDLPAVMVPWPRHPTNVCSHWQGD